MISLFEWGEFRYGSEADITEPQDFSPKDHMKHPRDPLVALMHIGPHSSVYSDAA